MNNELETRMRRAEWFHSLTVPAGMHTIIRVDGRAFSRLTESAHFEKPFDLKFAQAMWRTAQYLLTEFNGLYAYVESDEISLLLPREWDMFDRELEKIVSLTAATASASLGADLSMLLRFSGTPFPTFDSRIWLGATDADVLDYFSWRRADAFRCGINSWAYWTLVKEGLSARAATAKLDGLDVSAKNELLFERGININDVPAWQRRGVGMRWETYTKLGYNPIAQKEESAVRRRVKVDTELSAHSDDYRELVTSILSKV